MKNKAPVKPPKNVTFAAKSCRRSLCFSEDENVENEDGRPKREAALVKSGFYKE